MEVEDKSKIKEVIVLHPEFVVDNFSQLIRKEYEDILNMESKISSLRMKASELDSDLKLKKEKFHKLSNLFELKFESKDIKYNTNECNLSIINREDARNK